jgi:hypothetical protein
MIGPHDRTTLRGTMPVTMLPGTTAKCAGARFTITMSGIGDRADR